MEQDSPFPHPFVHLKIPPMSKERFYGKKKNASLRSPAPSAGAILNYGNNKIKMHVYV